MKIVEDRRCLMWGEICDQLEVDLNWTINLANDIYKAFWNDNLEGGCFSFIRELPEDLADIFPEIGENAVYDDIFTYCMLISLRLQENIDELGDIVKESKERFKKAKNFAKGKTIVIPPLGSEG